MLISIHIPKCGGTTFINVLRQNFNLHMAAANYGEIPQETNCIHGHFQSNKYNAIYPDADKITWIRDPAERLISNYLFDKHVPRPLDYELAGDRFTLQLRSGNVSIFEYAYRMGCAITKYLVDPIETFTFIGILEYFEPCIERFFNQFCYGAQMPIKRKNVQTSSVVHEFMSSLNYLQYRELRRLLRPGYEVYYEVVKNWGFKGK